MSSILEVTYYIKYSRMNKISFRNVFLSSFFVLFSLSLFSESTIDEGKTLFRTNCAQCHAKNMRSKATGPALGGVEERWADYPIEDLYAWIRNSQKLVAEEHPRAVEVYNEWNKVAMQAFPNLTDENIESILLYVNDVYVNGVGGAAGAVAGEAVAVQEKKTPNWVYYLLFGFLAILSLTLARIISNLNVISAEKEGRSFQRKTLVQTLTSKGVISFLLFAAVVLGGYTTVNNAIALGRQQGYAPDQPIKFSHATHAGLNKIDCQYCHDGARRSKHSVIPAANTCMNCHRAIKVGSEYGTAELTKIYASIGYNPTDNTYIDNYEEMTNEEIKTVYTKWIADNYVEANEIEALDEDGEAEVEKQWNGIVDALTNDQKKSIPGPIEWVRIHNLPDHAYFNHAQHVSVGKLECQECHGPVEEMALLQQHAPLSMGWCINCHRQTEVQFADNEYYKSYKKYHDELASGDRDKVTVEDIGGLECQKCHY